MPPPLLVPSSQLRINAEPLTPTAFSLFGTVIVSPLPTMQSSIPRSSPLPPPLHPSIQPEGVVANQSTALRYSPISPLINNLPDAPNHSLGTPHMSMFCCFPQTLSRDTSFEVKILERHPFTTQTFCPLGLAPNDPDAFFLVLVAPSLSDPLPATAPSGSKVQIQRPPDLRNLKAFVARGAQAVTYGVGTWHSPMVVLGSRRLDFVVTQFMSGVLDEDLQEVRIGEGIVVHLESGRRETKL
jgi:ureidoglycolate lyase